MCACCRCVQIVVGPDWRGRGRRHHARHLVVHQSDRLSVSTRHHRTNIVAVQQESQCERTASALCRRFIVVVIVVGWRTSTRWLLQTIVAREHVWVCLFAALCVCCVEEHVVHGPLSANVVVGVGGRWSQHAPSDVSRTTQCTCGIVCATARTRRAPVSSV